MSKLSKSSQTFGKVFVQSLLCIWVLPVDAEESSWNKQGGMLGTEIETCVASAPHRLCCVEGGAEKLDSLVNMRTIWKELKQAGVDILYSRDAGRSMAGICVILLITARSITVRGERPSSTFRRLAAWLRLTGWCLSCRPSSGPCWPSWRTSPPHQARPSNHHKQQRLCESVLPETEERGPLRRFRNVKQNDRGATAVKPQTYYCSLM
ncbi:unnamed protein product [Tetraodon nigroviridis]|uniref:(spotted green pufferfish) hypothetical protein n=1 Tax=Tetraodon nigroviridis TaxID=99883 RepID=Q4REV3_TETNG|nr:unnamed protein product [Tetraodon nigroviridis]